MTDVRVAKDTPPTASRWLRYGAPLVVIALFAACMLDFATLHTKHLPAHKRINNGQTPTFFAFHIGPSYNFSEDFHLYYLRAKRIERRGWTDSLFYTRPDERPNYAAPVQVLLSRLALLTDGAPRRYALFIFATLAIGWSMLYVAARNWLPPNIATSSILLTVMITVLFEAIHLIAAPPSFNSFGQWPTFRALRMSTMAWTSPLMVGTIILLTSLLRQRERWGARLVAFVVALALLVGTDNWAFAIVWVAAGIVVAWLGVSAMASWRRTRSGASAGLPLIAALSSLLLIYFAIHEQLNGSLAGDVLLRGGFGPEWRLSEDLNPNVAKMSRWLLENALVPVALVLLLSLVELRRRGSLQAITRGWRAQAHDDKTVSSTVPSLIERWLGVGQANRDAAPPAPLSDADWGQLRALAILPVAAAIAANLILSRSGMECFLRVQLYWRVDYCLLFATVLASAEWARTSLPMFTRWNRHTWAIVATIALTSLFAYHAYRTHWFVKHTARRDFFLTADAEKLRTWLQEFDRHHDSYELATASVELNFLSAFWTNADLLLPSGFPYHSAAPNQEILSRAVRLLRIYGTSAESWLKFTDPIPEPFTDLWLKSRVAAAGRGYLYHLFHRWTYYRPATEGEWFEYGRMEIADALRQPADTQDQPAPEVILVDDVSRELGDPDLSNYRLAHRFGSIEAWVRRDLAPTTAADR